MSGMTKITWDQAANNGGKPLLFDFCSAMKKERAEGELSLSSDPTLKHCCGVPTI